ncbi:MAG: class I SAM-dependent methyltransferase [Planctomycetaceae bacterium]
MLYASLTRHDRNPLKRFLQRKRTGDALALVDARPMRAVLDFGAGDGDLSRQLAAQFPHLQVCCFEPCAILRAEAIENTRGIANCDVCDSIEHLPDESFDAVFCLEVFEHLPELQLHDALRQIRRLLRPGGVAIIGVPVEIHLPALFKGLFRMARRFGAHDAKPWHVLRAFAGYPPSHRPLTEIDKGLPYHTHHLGFDHRALAATVEREQLKVCRMIGSPCPTLGRFFNSEVHFVVQKAA